MYSGTGNYWEAQATEWGPRVLIAILILIATWLIARAVKWALAKAISRTPALQKNTPGNQHETIGQQIGTIAKLIIWLVGIMAAVQFLGIPQILEPINRLVTDIFSYLDNVFGAGLIFFFGLILARIARRLVQTLLDAVNVDRLLGKAGLTDGNPQYGTPPVAAAGPATGTTTSGPTPARASISRAAGMLVFALIIIPVSIAALQVLGIEAISGPATNMLNQFLEAIPHVLSAALWIGLGFLLGKFVKSFIEAVLPPLGVDQAVRSIGIVPATTSASRILGNLALVTAVLFGAIEGAKQLGGGTIAIFLAQVTELGGKVIFGTLIIVAGIFLAKIISGFVGNSTGEGGFGQTLVRYAIIALFTAIGLTFMGLADVIVMMAFGLILGSAAVAAALAFGLGGRDAAARLLNQAADKAETQINAPSPTPRSPSGGATGKRRPPAAFGVTPRFGAFVAIDWSGAKGKRHKGIAIAEAVGDAPPRLVRPGHVWSREEVQHWLLKRAAKQPTLFGFDFSFAPPLIERGEYLPGEADVPNTAREFWAYVDSRSQDEDLGAASFLETAHRKHFYFGIADGVKADFVRFRECDRLLNAQGGRKTASAYDAIGAAQVAKASFSGMRLLHKLDDKVAIWPMDPWQDGGSAVVEIYTRIYLRRAGMSGTKLRTRSQLNEALAGLGSKPVRLRFQPNDHQTDALVTAAGMRALALEEPRAFAPPHLTPRIARSEGWTFGIL